MREIEFADGEYYHIYNRGVEKREIFSDRLDYRRFLQSMSVFNTQELVGSLYELSFEDKGKMKQSDHPLISMIAYCLNPNHFHFLLRQETEGGVSRYMRKLAGGYSWYYNHRYKRTGTLFQGPFKAKHIKTNEYFLRLSVYINWNDSVHQLGDQVAKYGEVSSRVRYEGHHKGVDVVPCDTSPIIGQFKNTKEYGVFTRETLQLIRRSKEMQKELASLSFD